jgi:hypothetical protein
MSLIKFQNVHGREGSFSFEGKKYSFLNSVLAVDKSEKSLIKYLKDSSSWADYKPSDKDQAKELKTENEELKKLLDESTKENEELKKLLDESTKVNDK